MSEQVLVIPKSLAEELCPTPFGQVPESVESRILSQGTFLNRAEAEINFDWKQVIPYIVVKHSVLYLLSQRTKQQEEKRLHDKYSLGQGGHINDLDFRVHHGNGDRSPIINGLLREIAEEFTLGKTLSCEPVGMINDNSNEVGRVHIGLIYLLTVDSTTLTVAEKGKHIAQWASAGAIQDVYDLLENWSKIVFDNLIK